MRETILNRGQGAINFMKEHLNVNFGVRKVRCPHNFCQDCSFETKIEAIVMSTFVFYTVNTYYASCLDALLKDR
jgi:hypothetical protein